MEFETIKLGDLYDVASGLSKSAKEFGNGGYPFLSFKTIFYNYFLPDELPDLANTTGKEQEKCSILEGDVFLTRTSETANELGMSSVALKDYPCGTFNGFSKRLRMKQNCGYKVYPKYMGYFLRSAKFRNQINSMSIASTRASLNIEMINRLTVDLPDIECQKKIADFLFLIDKKIKNSEAINRNLLDQGRALYEDLISKYEINAKLSDLISSIETGSRPKGGAQESGVPSIGAEKIESFGVYDYSGEKYISEEFFEKLKRGHILSGDVLLYKDGAYTGKTSMALNDFPHAKCAINEHVYKLNSNNNLYQFFLYFTLDNKKNRDYIYTLASSKAAQPGLNQTELLSVDIAMPVETSLIEFEKNVSEMMNMIASNAKENRKLTLLRDSLLPKLMSGEIDVSELDV